MKQFYLKKLIFAALLLISTSAMAQPYCSVPTSDCSLDKINRFSTTGGLTNITNNGSGCSSNGYSLHTNTQVTIPVGGTFNFSVRCGPYQPPIHWNNGQKFAIYIDWNNDSTFNSTNELIWTGGNYYTYTALTGTITAPTSAYGSFRMRVRSTNSTNPPTPCSVWGTGKGETEDYIVNIYNPITTDAGIAQIESPVLPACTFDTTDIIVTLKNDGTDTLTSAIVNCSVNGTLLPAFNWTGTILPVSSEQGINIGSHPFTINDTVVVWTSSPNGSTDTEPANDTVSIKLIQGMSGTYTVGTASSDFLTITEAVDTMKVRGVCGPVIFDVANNTYVESVVLSPIPGASSINSIRFNGNQSTMTQSNAQGAILIFSGGDHFTFDNFRFVKTDVGATANKTIALQFNPGADSNTISNSLVYAPVYTNATSIWRSVIRGNNSSYNKFLNDSISGGNMGIYWYNNSNKLTVNNCDFSRSFIHGIKIKGHNGIIFKNNTFTSNSNNNNKSAIFLENTNGWIRVESNKIAANTNARPWKKGIVLKNTHGLTNNRGLVANNFITTGDSTSTLGGLTGIQINSVTKMDIVHNSIANYSSNPNNFGRALYVASATVNIFNNSLANFGNGVAMRLGSLANITSNGNNLYTTDTVIVMNTSSSYMTLNQWKSTGNDTLGTSVDPLYMGFDDLHTCNILMFNSIDQHPNVLKDIDLNPRSIYPTIGASEISILPSNFLGNDVYNCPGDSVKIGTQLFAQFTWSGASQDSIGEIWAHDTGNYKLSVQTLCYSFTDSISIFQTTYEVFDTVYACSGDSIAFEDGNVIYALQNDTNYTSTFQTIVGCDSLYHSVVYVAPNYSTDDTIYACQGDTVTFADGSTLSGVQTDLQHISSLQTVAGCDSIFTTQLIVYTTYNNSTNTTICYGDSFTFMDGTVMANIQSTVDHNNQFQTVEGCDSIIVETIDVEQQIDTTVVRSVYELTATSNADQYQWVTCPDYLPVSQGDTNQIFTATQNGSYAVLVTKGDCSSYSECFEINNVSIQDRSKSLFQIYPSPAQEYLMLDFKGNTITGTIQITDLTGKIIITKTFESNQLLQLNVSHLVPGIYTVQVQSQSLYHVNQFIKQ